MVRTVLQQIFGLGQLGLAAPGRTFDQQWFVHARCQVHQLQGHRIDDVARRTQPLGEFTCRREHVGYLPGVNTTPESVLLHFSQCAFRAEAGCLLNCADGMEAHVLETGDYCIERTGH